ncbi:MAG: hypothetical protein ABIH35_03805 [Patescibacteria group bacterium]
MQTGSTYRGAFDTLRRTKLRSEKLKVALKKIKEQLKQKPNLPKLKNFIRERAHKAQLTNLRLVIKLRKKMDAVKQNIRKTD